ncbi:MAG: dephospho-CoA kinase [Bacteroidaceae bacterium]|nr:dephospho-CoA kinase [Bacteroidaceae bacterium]
MAFKLGITGGIGSGKSGVSELLRVMGIPVYDCDKEASRLMHQSPEIRRQLTLLAGEGVYDENGMLNRKMLASFMFGNESRVRAVNAIVHPSVRADFRRWAEEKAHLPFVGLESAILYEAGMKEDVDAVVLVYTPAEERLQRAMARDNVPEEQIRRRMNSQMLDENKLALADYVIRNAENDAVTPQVLELLQSLR